MLGHVKIWQRLIGQAGVISEWSKITYYNCHPCIQHGDIFMKTKLKVNPYQFQEPAETGGGGLFREQPVVPPRRRVLQLARPEDGQPLRQPPPARRRRRTGRDAGGRDPLSGEALIGIRLPSLYVYSSVG